MEILEWVLRFFIGLAGGVAVVMIVTLCYAGIRGLIGLWTRTGR
jgi:hypothetical protein